jgi:hypothetical protein
MTRENTLKSQGLTENRSENQFRRISRGPLSSVKGDLFSGLFSAASRGAGNDDGLSWKDRRSDYRRGIRDNRCPQTTWSKSDDGDGGVLAARAVGAVRRPELASRLKPNSGRATRAIRPCPHRGSGRAKITFLSEAGGFHPATEGEGQIFKVRMGRRRWCSMVGRS